MEKALDIQCYSTYKQLVDVLTKSFVTNKFQSLKTKLMVLPRP